MSHRDNCPDDHEARARARDDARYDQEYGWGRSYHSRFDCDEAQESYRREYGYQMDRLEEERQMERAAQRRREEQQAEEQYWAECQARAEDDRAAEEAEYLASLEAMAASQPQPE